MDVCGTSTGRGSQLLALFNGELLRPSDVSSLLVAIVILGFVAALAGFFPACQPYDTNSIQESRGVMNRFSAAGVQAQNSDRLWRCPCTLVVDRC